VQGLGGLVQVEAGHLSRAAVGGAEAGLRWRRGAGGGVVVELEIGIVGVRRGHHDRVGAHALGQAGGQPHRVRQLRRVAPRTLGRQLGGAGADDADRQHQQRHQHFHQRESARRPHRTPPQDGTRGPHGAARMA
jgi:hypothetical protein